MVVQGRSAISPRGSNMKYLAFARADYELDRICRERINGPLNYDISLHEACVCYSTLLGEIAWEGYLIEAERR
jgi:hypothetical protein